MIKPETYKKMYENAEKIAQRQVELVPKEEFPGKEKLLTGLTNLYLDLMCK